MIMNKAIGLLGGTFDPIHVGHTLPVEAISKCLMLDKVIFLPANIPPHKACPNVSADDRATMVELACQKNSLFECDTRELNRNGHSYTIDTLKEIAALYPQQNLYFIMGMDSLLTFTTWNDYLQILNLCNIVVNTRPNYLLPAREDLPLATQQLLTEYGVNAAKHVQTQTLETISVGAIIFSQDLYSINKLLPVNIDISSTEIRGKLVKEESCQHLLDASVIKYIDEKKLYR
jgi:nicotinate-nucleotide adenylyltransferase